MPMLIKNKKVTHDYQILETIEAGIGLFGYEVKSIRNKNGSLKGAYVTLGPDGAYLVGANIPPYQPANIPGEYDPKRSRRLLLTKKELQTLIGIEKQGGLTIVPISMYTKRRHIKLEIAIVRGKKKKDRRQALRKRDEQRQIERTLKNQ